MVDERNRKARYGKSDMRLCAGTLEEIPGHDSLWCYLDIGFSAANPSCGLLIGDHPPKEVLFSEARDALLSVCRSATDPISIVIEAPLSVAFSPDGNPRGRSIEKRGAKTRYWHTGLGCVVLTAAGYIVCALAELPDGPDIRLFEGFVSFKEKGKVSSHKDDVILLWDVVNGNSQNGQIVSPGDLTMADDDRIEGAFAVWGLDTGVPPVIIGG